MSPEPAKPRPFLRPLLVWIYAGPSMALAVFLGFLLTPFLGRRQAFWLLAPGWVRHAAAAFGIRRHLEGWDTLPEAIRNGRQPAIFAANHTSLFDPPLIVSTLPCRPVFIAKKELAWVPILGWVIWLAGFIFIDRGNRPKAIASLKKAAQQIRDGQSVAAFPEGTRSRMGTLLPFKKGIFNLAMEAGVPLVPMAIQGGPEVLPPGNWRVASADYRVQMGQPLDPRQFESSESMKLAAEDAIRQLLMGSQKPFQRIAK